MPGQPRGIRVGVPVAMAAAVVLALGACGNGPGGGDGRLPPVPFRVTEEEASLLVAGELIRIYGLEADPVPVEVSFTRGELDGQPVWRVDALVDVTLEGERVQRRWTFWVGERDGDPAILRSEGPAGDAVGLSG